MSDKFKLAVTLCLVLAACGPAPDTQMQTAVGGDPRVKVTRIGVIEDKLAYGNVRGIYVINDTKTGSEFIGVSGIGITEVGSHQSGKSSHEDER